MGMKIEIARKKQKTTVLDPVKTQKANRRYLDRVKATILTMKVPSYTITRFLGYLCKKQTELKH